MILKMSSDFHSQKKTSNLFTIKRVERIRAS